MVALAQIFLSYARQDEEKVEKLYQKLSDAGFKPWMDTKDILPGERWKSSIQKAIRRSDFFLACLSANSVNKRGFLQKEIKNALDIWQEMLEDDIYLIPVQLEDCEVPDSLLDFQWVNLFEEAGWAQLVKAIQIGMERRAEAIGPIVQESTPFEPYPVHDGLSVGTKVARPPKESSERVRRPRRTEALREMRMGNKEMKISDQFNTLLDFIQFSMTAPEFEEMVARLLTPRERAGLPSPLTRVGFLDSVRIWGRLGDVQCYLRGNFAERFKG